MMRTLWLVALLSVALDARESLPSSVPSSAETEILAVVDRFFVALAANDFASMVKLRVEGSVNFVESPSDGGGTRLTRRIFTADSLKPGHYREQYWDPVVKVRGRIGMVWAPYEFWLDEKSHHCGIDVFEMVKDETGWKIANLMWTVEPAACAELRPSDPSRMRPMS